MNKRKSSFNEEYTIVINGYLDFCRKKGNSSSVLKLKEKVCTEFLEEMTEYGKVFETLDASTVGKICISKINRNKWRIYRPFLKYLFSENKIDTDLSIIVPRYSEREPVPAVYSIEEIRQLEASIDRSTSEGKMNYLLVLLASRMGFRRSDIAKMTFESIDFKRDKIKLIQQKTGEEIELCLVEAVKSALNEYIRTIPESKQTGKLFSSITEGYITRYVRRLMLSSGININGRRLGPHALRSSLATSMVNDGVSYEVIRKILGHYDHNSVRKYAKLDIENLRKCALEVPPPQGNYKNLMNGGRI